MSAENPTCKEVMHYICEHLGEDLNSEKCVAIKNHLDNCPRCQSYFKTVELTVDFYKEYNVKMPEDAHKRLMSFLNLSDCDE